MDSSRGWSNELERHMQRHATAALMLMSLGCGRTDLRRPDTGSDVHVDAARDEAVDLNEARYLLHMIPVDGGVFDAHPDGACNIQWPEDDVVFAIQRVPDGGLVWWQPCSEQDIATEPAMGTITQVAANQYTYQQLPSQLNVAHYCGSDAALVFSYGEFVGSFEVSGQTIRGHYSLHLVGWPTVPGITCDDGLAYDFDGYRIR